MYSINMVPKKMKTKKKNHINSLLVIPNSSFIISGFRINGVKVNATLKGGATHQDFLFYAVEYSKPEKTTTENWRDLFYVRCVQIS